MLESGSGELDGCAVIASAAGDGGKSLNNSILQSDYASTSTAVRMKEHGSTAVFLKISVLSGSTVFLDLASALHSLRDSRLVLPG
jgi:hypothetical protein